MVAHKSIKLIFLGSILSLVAVVIIVFGLLKTLPEVANQQAFLRSSRAVEAAVKTEQAKLAGVLLDNSLWSEAVRHCYGKEDRAWLDSTWGRSTNQGNYDTVFLVDHTGQTLWSHANGEGATDGTLREYAGKQLESFLRELSSGGKPNTIIDIFWFNGSLLVMGGAPIISDLDSEVPPIEKTRFLVFAKILDIETLSDIADRVLVSKLSFLNTFPESIEQFNTPLRNLAGDIVAYANWEDIRPGDIARNSVQLPTMMVLICFFIYTLWLLRVAIRTYKEILLSADTAEISARKDTLTGLPNRKMFYEKLRELQHLPNKDTALLLIDLDGFKDVNDSYGHEVGDNLLKKIAGTFSYMLGMGEILARLGGDEFAIIVTANSNAKERAERLANSLIRQLDTVFDLDGRKVSVGASIGLSTCRDLDKPVSEFLRRADVAMYEAKRRGCNQVCVYDSTLDTARNRKTELAAELGRALSRREIKVVYQPIFKSTSRTIIGVEALARWTHETNGPISPQEFVPIAEEFGLIDELGRQVLELACREAARWPKLKVSVNISPAQFKNPGFVSMVLSIIDANGVSRDQLELEVTETYLIEHQEQSKSVIDRLNAEGISVALDDFGTGYSSLGYLRKYRFSKLKLDRSMVTGVAGSLAAQKIFQATVLLAKSLDLSITAEGVEHEDEAGFVELMGCDFLQGYLLGRPQLAEGIDQLLNYRPINN
nr:bifunctional diguanylate cyclase/phosphodiesterase [uncultured Pseudomonas sp.]